MRFARHATIFRGPLDAAAVASVLFLLFIFLLLSSLLYTPGVLVRLEASAAPSVDTIIVTGHDEVVFNGKTNQPTDLASLRDDLRNWPGAGPLALQVQPGASPRLVEQVRDLFQVQLPHGDNLVGTDNEIVRVAVNFRGQCFFENRQISDEELRAILRHRLEEASSASKKLTLVLSADEAAKNDVIMRLGRLARSVGVSEIILPEESNVFGPQPGRARP
jgi:biopolymer transport protein ExbD